MKKTTLISLMVFWGFMVAILTAGLVFSQNKTETNKNDSSKTAVLGESENNDASEEVLVLSASEVAKHKGASDCWMIISNKVYDFTPYMNSHPGGAGTIVPYCGKDGTAAFSKKPHSAYAASLLPKYYLGDLNSTIKSQNAKVASTGNRNTVVSPTSSVKQPVYPPQTPTTTIQNQAPQQQGSGLTASDVASHNNASDCWMIVSGKVYNVTSYIPSHPGGAGSITAYCGKDATSAFSGHSQNAASILGSYYIGDLGTATTAQGNNTQTLNTNSVNQNQQTSQVPVQSTVARREHDDDDDDD